MTILEKFHMLHPDLCDGKMESVQRLCPEHTGIVARSEGYKDCADCYACWNRNINECQKGDGVCHVCADNNEDDYP